MPFLRVIELPVVDDHTTLPVVIENAKAMLDIELAKVKTTLTVVIGNSQPIIDAIPLADYNALLATPFFDRWVVWVKERDQLISVIGPLLEGAVGENSDLSYNDINCFSLSPVSRKATGIYHKQTELTDLRFDRSTVFAEAIDGI